MSNKTKILLVLIVSALVGVAAFLVWSPRSKPPATYTYSCYYRDGGHQARCVSQEDPKAACYGYYDLVGTHPEDGIKPNSSTNATCEAFSGPPQFYYDHDGKLIR
jgi:hypothetical protein